MHPVFTRAEVERTLVDVLHRLELVVGVEDGLKSLYLARYLDPTKVADYVELLDNRSIASVPAGGSRNGALGVTDVVLARLRARLPRSKHYALGAQSGHVVLVEPWRVLLPRHCHALPTRYFAEMDSPP